MMQLIFYMALIHKDIFPSILHSMTGMHPSETQELDPVCTICSLLLSEVFP